MLVGYTRCSTTEQADGSTIQDQERKIKGFAMMKGVESFDLAFFSDPGVSGSKHLDYRPAGHEMMQALKKGDIVVAAKLDRLFRSASDALHSVETLQKMGVSVVLLDMGMEPVTENGISKLFFTMLSAFAEFERTRINDRTEDGRRAKKARGGVIGNIPYGYRRKGIGRLAVLELDEYEQRVLTQVQQAVGAFPAWNLHNGCHRDAGDVRLFVRSSLSDFKDRTGKPFTKLVQIEVLIKAARARGLNQDEAAA